MQENESAMKLRPHQQEALGKMSNGKILVGGVGSGKSMVAVAYYQTLKSTSPVYVITTARKRDSLDWNREFARAAIGTTSDSTVAGVLTVDSWNNIGKYENLENAFFIFDEQRLVGNGSWVKSFLKIAKNNPWIMLTATPGDTWLDYIPVFIANGFYKNRTEFKLQHVVYRHHMKFPIVDHYMGTGKLLRLRQQIIVEMPYERHTTRHTVLVKVDHDMIAMKKAMKERWNPFTDEPMRGAAELCHVTRRIANSHPSRLKAVREALKKHDRLIVFYNFDFELEALRTLEGIQIAEWNGHKHDEVPETDKWVYLVQYVAGAEAWECIRTNATLFYSQTYSYKNLEQAYGRIDRMNTPYTDLWYYYLMSTAKIDLAIRKAMKQKRDFNVSGMSDS